jgi:hypothetical protein
MCHEYENNAINNNNVQKFYLKIIIKFDINCLMFTCT